MVGTVGRKGFSIVIFAGSILLVCAGRLYADEANYVGSETCAACHEDKAKAFSTNVHSKADSYGAKISGCESCHGPGAKHAETTDKSAIINPGKVRHEKGSAICLECHSKNKKMLHWDGSSHEGQKMACESCHNIHGGNEKFLAKKNQIDLCFSCHYNVRADILKRSKHPLRDSSSSLSDGKMVCSSCHNPHGAQSEKLIDAKSVNDKCYECHIEKKAPVLWEHSPVKEDCLTCHKPHGSSNDKMLVTKVPRLCQQCHMQGRHQSGTLATSSTYAFNRGCLNCHPKVHGSNSPSGAVLQR